MTVRTAEMRLAGKLRCRAFSYLGIATILTFRMDAGLYRCGLFSSILLRLPYFLALDATGVAAMSANENAIETFGYSLPPTST
jgi:hypothetical protein